MFILIAHAALSFYIEEEVHMFFFFYLGRDNLEMLFKLNNTF